VVPFDFVGLVDSQTFNLTQGSGRRGRYLRLLYVRWEKRVAADVGESFNDSLVEPAKSESSKSDRRLQAKLS